MKAKAKPEAGAMYVAFDAVATEVVDVALELLVAISVATAEEFVIVVVVVIVVVIVVVVVVVIVVIVVVVVVVVASEATSSSDRLALLPKRPSLRSPNA